MHSMGMLKGIILASTNRADILDRVGLSGQCGDIERHFHVRINQQG